MDNPKEILPESRESSDKVENPRSQKLDDATFEPRSLIEQTGDYGQSEAIQNTFSGMMDKLQPQEETAKAAAPQRPGELNRSQAERSSGEGDVKGSLGTQVSITPINLPNIAGSAEGAITRPGGDPTDEGGTPNFRARIAAPTGESIDRKGILKQTEELDELTEEQSLKLQEAMDRRAKIEQTLSNEVKKIGNTQEDIIQNMK